MLAEGSEGGGARHAADPVVFAVDAGTMQANDHRILKRRIETGHVPPRYLAVLDETRP